VTLIVIAAGGQIPEHQAEGPITVQPIEGSIRFTADDVDHDLQPGAMLFAGPRVRHRVSSERGASFLLTVSHPGPGPSGATV
jgi:quercetin dioxygenase-like cupin family protein